MISSRSAKAKVLMLYASDTRWHLKSKKIKPTFCHLSELLLSGTRKEIFDHFLDPFPDYLRTRSAPLTAPFLKKLSPLNATPIHYLAMRGLLDIVPNVLSLDALFPTMAKIPVDNGGRSIAHYAACFNGGGSIYMIQKIRPALLLSKDKENRGIEHYAAWMGCRHMLHDMKRYNQSRPLMEKLSGSTLISFKDPEIGTYAAKGGFEYILKWLHTHYPKLIVNNPNVPFITAKKGNLATLRMLARELGTRALFKARGDGGINIAHVAAKHGHLSILKWIKSQRALAPLLREVTPRGENIAHIAITAEPIDDATRSSLLSWIKMAGLGALFNMPDTTKRFPFDYAIQTNKTACITFFLTATKLTKRQRSIARKKLTSPPPSKTKASETPSAPCKKLQTLMFAFSRTKTITCPLTQLILSRDLPSIIEHFSKNPADIKKRLSPLSATPLHYLTVTGDIVNDLFQQFIADSKEVAKHLHTAASIVDNNWRSIAHYAAFGASLETLEWVKTHFPKLLSSKGLDKDYISKYAAWGGDPRALDWIKSHNIKAKTLFSSDKPIPLDLPETAIHAAKSGKRAALKWIQANLPHLLAKSQAHIFAAHDGNLSLLKWLINQKDAGIKLLNTPVVGEDNIAHIAARHSHLPVLKWMQTVKELSPLLKTKQLYFLKDNIAHTAARWGHLPVLKWILSDKTLSPLLYETDSRGAKIATLGSSFPRVKWILENLGETSLTGVILDPNNKGSFGHIGNVAHYLSNSGELPCLKQMNAHPTLSKLLTKKDSQGLTIAHYATNKEIWEWIKTVPTLAPMLTSKDSNGRNIAFYATSLEQFKWIKRFYPALLTARDIKGNNFTHCLLSSFRFNTLNIFKWIKADPTLAPLLTMSSSDGHNIAHYLFATDRYGEKKYQQAFLWLQSDRTLSSLCKAKDKNGYNIAHFFAISHLSPPGNNMRYFTGRVNQFTTILEIVANNKTLSPLLIGKSHEGYNIAHLFAFSRALSWMRWIELFPRKISGRLLKSLLSERTLNENNIAHLAALGSAVNILSWINSHRVLTLTILLLKTNKDGRNIAHLASLIDGDRVLTWIKKAGYGLLFLTKDRDKKLPFDIAVEKKSVKCITFFKKHTFLTVEQSRIADKLLSMPISKPTKEIRLFTDLISKMPTSFSSKARKEGKTGKEEDTMEMKSLDDTTSKLDTPEASLPSLARKR